MSGAAQVDYDALAQQHGGTAVAAPSVDYDALAQQHGGMALTPAPASPAAAIASGASPESLMAATQQQAKSQVTGTPMREMAPLESNATANFIQQQAEKNNGPQFRDKEGDRLPTYVHPAKLEVPAGKEEVAKAAQLIPQVAGAVAPSELFEPVMDAISSFRAARAAKLATDSAEWQRINGVLNVPKSGVIVSPSSAAVADAVKMPGRTLAKLGYSADDLQKMDPIVRMNVIDSHLQNAGSAIESAAQSATKAGKTVDLSGVVTNVFKNVTDPDMKAKMIDQFYEKAKSLGISLPTVTPEDALALRRALREGQTFSGFSDAKTAANVSKQLGSAVSGELKNAVPDFVNLDQDYTDLRGARDAARSQVQMTLKKAPPPTAAQKFGRFLYQRVLPRAAEGAAGGAAAYWGYHLMHDMSGEGQP